jgi:hypothetical protein
LLLAEIIQEVNPLLVLLADVVGWGSDNQTGIAVWDLAKQFQPIASVKTHSAFWRETLTNFDFRAEKHALVHHLFVAPLQLNWCAIPTRMENIRSR